MFLKFELLLVENFIAIVCNIYRTITQKAANFPSIFFFFSFDFRFVSTPVSALDIPPQPIPGTTVVRKD